MLDNASIYWVGWCHEDNHDKIWGVLKLPNTYVSFWGKRGSSRIGFKNLKTQYDARTMIGKKEAPRGNYTQISEKRMCEIWSEFDDTISSQLTFATLCNLIK